MFRMRNRISGIRFDEKKYLRDAERITTKIVKEAAREWLIAVLNTIKNAPFTDGDSFPIKTGEAKGSLLPLAAILNQSQVRVNVPVTPAPGFENRISVGRSKGHVKLGKTGARMIFNFSFDSDVLHFELNEFFDMGYGPDASITPWNVRLAGAAAFREHIQNHLVERLPRMKRYVIFQTANGEQLYKG